MGGIFSCVQEVSELQRPQYDMTPIKTNSVPIIWMVGASGSGRHIQAKALTENLQYENIQVANLIKGEALKETDRGRLIKKVLRNLIKNVPDTIVMDLIKDEMLQRASYAKGFLLNGFPRTNKQALLFVEEVTEVDVIIYLYSDLQVMITRTKEKKGDRVDYEAIKRDIQSRTKEIKEGTSKFDTKLEKIYTDVSPAAVYGRILRAVNVRIKKKLANSNHTELDILESMEQL